MRGFQHLLRRQSVVALAVIIGMAAAGLITLVACAPMTRPAAELPTAARDHTGFNVVPDRETAETIAVAVSRAMLADKDEFTKFLPFYATLDGNIWRVGSTPVQPESWGPCSESLYFNVEINRDTGEILDLTVSHSEGGLNSGTPACQMWTHEQAEPYSESVVAYFQALAKVCPDKNLERLTPGQLNSVVALFRRTLSVVENNSFDSWSQTKCTTNDLICTNGGYLRAARDLNMAQRLAEKACASNFACRSDGTACEQTNPPR